jgi:sporulation protein YlmC with PRC-barrel domain
MMKYLLTSAAVLSAVAFGAMAQTSTDQPADSTQQTVPAPPAPQAGTAPADQGTTQSTEAQPPATPPPAEAVIPAQNANQLMADKLLGLSVYSNNGEQVGKVSDIIVDKDGKVSGVVLSVGGFFGMGGKSVALNWQEVQLQPDEQAAKVSYTQDQLKVAPEFKTQDQLADEAAQKIQEQPMPQSSGSSGTSTQ